MGYNFKAVGIDPGNATTAVVAILDGVLMGTKAIRSGKTGPARWVEIEDEVERILDICKPELICLEGYGFCSGSGNAQAELGGVLRRRLFKGGFEYIEVAPSQVKKFCTGKGNGPKDVILKEVLKRWGADMATNDEADAYVLARIAEALISVRRDPLNFKKYIKPQQEVVLALLTPKAKKTRGGRGKKRGAEDS